MPQPPLRRRLSPPYVDATPLPAGGRPFHLPATNLEAGDVAAQRSLTAASAMTMETGSRARSPPTMAEPRGHDGHHHQQQHRRLHRRCASASAASAGVPVPSSSLAWEEERRLRRSPPVEARRERERRRARDQPRCGEVAGGTAAECAAVCCCFPCAVVELVVLAAVRVPAALCRRAIRARRRRRRAARAAAQAKKKEMDDLVSAAPKAIGSAAKDGNGDAMDFCYWPPPASTMPNKHDDDLADAEEEVWARFQGAGFWRSPSQREERR